MPEDGRLVADGMTLRRRTGGDDEGWHLKLPVGRHYATRSAHPSPTPRRAPSPGPSAPACGPRP
ncbi:hypothetical protein RM572_02170 [Streptomyces sp. DSM 42041]|uniref:Uncharacterized protein n=1 Tax=Streptomyces hazeniae TaxID=3075538 RepID=A0ABU2NKQ8_9ACTN|nr:hypothetical protein [Streptomyces sp. DSM 42041]MDT0377580.1 hypothetical protein [Streptomyces sp. DSM 42041]